MENPLHLLGFEYTASQSSKRWDEAETEFGIYCWKSWCELWGFYSEGLPLKPQFACCLPLAS